VCILSVAVSKALDNFRAEGSGNLNKCVWLCFNSFDALVMRFEAPDSRNRWDRPLFVLQSDDPLPCQQIYEALFHSKAPPPNLSTLSVGAQNITHATFGLDVTSFVIVHFYNQIIC